MCKEGGHKKEQKKKGWAETEQVGGRRERDRQVKDKKKVSQEGEVERRGRTYQKEQCHEKAGGKDRKMAVTEKGEGQWRGKSKSTQEARGKWRWLEGVECEGANP